MNLWLLLLACSVLLSTFSGNQAFTFGTAKYEGCYAVPGHMHRFAKSVFIKGYNVKAFRKEACKGKRIPDKLVKRVMKAYGVIS